jgi:hypothetical protein
MSSLTDHYQQYECPSWFQDELTRVGGVNRYDEPNFRCVWGMGGQDECFYRAGGCWHVEGQPSFTGYRNLLLGGGTPSWMLLQWQDATTFGTPESYYVAGYDEESGLQTLGEYPYQGKYILLYNMCWRDMQNGKMNIEAMPLNSFILNLIVPIILQSKDISWEKTKAVMKEMQEKDDAADLAVIEDAMRDAALSFKGPSSYARQGCRTWHIDKKIEEMTRNWNRMVNNARSLGRGLSVHSENPTH